MRRKELANQKVIRAITLGLAAFMAIQSPMAVLAENGTTQQTGNENGASKQQTVPTEIQAVQDVAKTADNEDKENLGAAQLIDTAQQEVEKAEPTPTPVVTSDNPTPTTPADPAATLKQELTNAGNYVDNAKTQLDNAGSDMQDGVKLNADADQMADKLIANIGKDFVTIQVPKVDEDGNPVFEQAVDENGVPQVDEQGSPVYVQAVDEDGNPRYDEDGNPVYKQVVEDRVIVGGYDAAEIQSSSDADFAMQNAVIANTSGNENTARQAKAAAETNVTNSEKELGQAKKAVKNAEDNVASIEDEIKKVTAKSEEAKGKLQSAKTALGNAKTNSENAATEMENAKTEVERLQGELDTLYGQMYDAEIEAIKTQNDLIQAHVEAKKAKGESFKDQTYWDETLKLCNMIIKSYILKKEGISNVQIGNDFSVNLVTGYEKDGDPAPRLGKAGDLVNSDGYIVDENGNVLLYQNYKPVIGTFVEKAGEINIKEGWIRSNNNQDNRVVVTYTKIEKDENGEETQKTVEEYYNYKANDDGTIYVYQREYRIDKNGDIIIQATPPVAEVEGKAEVPYQAAVPEQPAVPSSWKTGEGEDAKVFAKTETTHMVSIDSNEEISEPGEGGKGFWAIDTATNPIETPEPDSIDTIVDSDNHKTTTYEEKEGVERKVEYQYVPPYVVTLGYEQKEKPKPKDYSGTSELETAVSSLKEEGYEVQIVCHRWIGDNVIKDSTDWGDDVVAFIHRLFGEYKSFTLSVTNTVDDKDKPITETREGIREIVTGYYTEKMVEENTINSGKYGSGIGNGYDEALAAYNVQKKYWEDLGYTVTGGVVPNYGGFFHDDTCTYTLTYRKETTKDVEKTLSSKLYAADAFTNYDPGKPYVAAKPEVPYQPAVEAVEEIIGSDEYQAEKVVWYSDNTSIAKAREKGTMVESEAYLKLINDYQTKRSELNGKIEAYKAAKTAVVNAEERVEVLRGQIAELGNVEYNNQKLIELETLLKEAKTALSDAKAREVELEKKVNDARAAVNSIDLSRFDQVPDDDDTPSTPGTPGAIDEGGEGGDGGSTSGTPAAPTRPTAGNRTADADGDATNDGVLGARNGGRGGRGGRGAGAGNGEGNTTTIGDGRTALAGSIQDATGKTADKADEETKKTDNVNIEDEGPALGSFDDVNEESHNWLWWILALLAGAVTIEEFTRRQLNKKKAAQVSSSEADK